MELRIRIRVDNTESELCSSISGLFSSRRSKETTTKRHTAVNAQTGCRLSAVRARCSVARLPQAVQDDVTEKRENEQKLHSK